MKKKHTHRIYDSMAAAAAGEGRPLAELRQLKAAGHPAFRNSRIYGDELPPYVAANPAKQPAKQPAKRAAAVGEAPTAAGAAFALKRLEEAERTAYEQMRAAEAAGDHGEAARRRRAWLQVADALRKGDVALEERRRITGELVPRELVEKALHAFAYFLNAVWMPNAHWFLADLRANPHMRDGDLFKALSNRLRFNVITSAAAATAASDPRLPGWFIDATTWFWSKYPYPTMPAAAAELADLLRQCIADAAPAPVNISTGHPEPAEPTNQPGPQTNK